MAMVKVKMRLNGRCPKKSRHVKGRKGCWRTGKRK